MPDLSRRAFLGGFLACGTEALLARPAMAGREAEALLLACHVAGTSYRLRGLADVEPALAVGDALILQREPGNPADLLAIAVFDRRRRHLGYVPRAKNEVLARLMDAGVGVDARLDSKAWVGDWLRLEMSVFLPSHALPVN